jgi:tRNA U34 5-carboxymethylaminomethyl modifying GTPase MnmE/TrmE
MRRRFFLGFAIYVVHVSVVFIPQVQAATAVLTWQQQAQPEQPQKQAQHPLPKTHKIKIWTNDDLIALRTPMDIYILEKEARVVANEAKTLMACFAFGQPEGTIEETQKAIQDTLQSMRDSEEAIAQVRKELEDVPENLKARNQKELERRTAELETARERLKTLQEHLRELTKQPAVENPVAPPTASPE